MTRNKLTLIVLAFLFFPLLSFATYKFPERECKEVWAEKKLKKTQYLYNSKTYPPEVGYSQFYGEQGVDRRNCYKQWSVFIYINADNDLSPFSIMDLHEMESLGSSISVDVVAQLDTNKDTGSRRLHISKDPKEYEPWSKKQVLENDLESKLVSPIAEQLSEINSGSKLAFKSFLDWAFQKYPAKHYAVLLWSHGMGWDAKISDDFRAKPTHVEDVKDVELPLSEEELEDFQDDESRYVGGISFDESAEGDNTHLRIPELRSVLSYISAEYLKHEDPEIKKGRPIDVYGSDACLMQMEEVAFEFKNQARYIVGSANMEGKMGWPYRRILRALIDAPYGSEHGRDPAEHWVSKIPDYYRESYSGGTNSSQGYDQRSIMSVIYTHEMRRYFPMAMSNFGNALMQYLKEVPKKEGKRYDAIRYLIGQTFTYSGLSQDIYYFTILVNLMLIEKREKNGELTFIEQNLRDTIIELQNAINRSVPYRAASDYYYSSSVYGATRGLAVWLPASNEEFKEHIDRYKRSRLYRFDIRRAREENREGWVSFNEYIHSKDGFQGLGSLDSR